MVQKVSKKWITADSRALFEAILGLKTLPEAQNFFRDLLTEAEIKEFSSRWKAVRMLSDKASYTEITAATGLSSRTIARINSWLKQGMGGYRMMIKRTSP